MKRLSAQPYRSALFLALFCFCLCTEALAQNVQNANETMDLGMRSTRKINPTSLALEFQIPLGHYRGRNGFDVPVVLSYSSRLWEMKFQGYVPGPPPPHGGIEPFTIVTAQYASHSLAGWSSSVSLPTVDFTPGDKIYTSEGVPNITGNCTNGCFKIDRLLVWMPDGSAHELRASDQPRNTTAPLPDDYYAVDGSRMRYQRSTGTLFLPDGSRVIGGQHIDRNGNTITVVTGGLRDTLGRVINNPLSFSQGFGAGDHSYTLPGVGNTTLNYTFKWRNLGDVLTTPGPLSYKGNSGCPPGSGGTFSPNLFSSDTFSRTCIGNSSEFFNPVVLYQIVLPNNQTYTFTYNAYGEITKVVLPTGGYETFVHSPIAGTSSNLTGVYAQPNRGVTRHAVNPIGSGTDEDVWLYSKIVSGSGTLVTKTAQDLSRTESNLWGDAGSSWGYSVDSSRAGRPFDERVYNSANQMIRRKLTQLVMTPSNAAGNFSGTLTANRNARTVKELEFIFDTGGGPALAKTTTYGYDLTFQYTVGIEQTSVNEFAYLDVDQNTAQTLSINSLPTFSTGTRVRTTETDYLTSDANYRSRNILGFPLATRIKDALDSDKIVAQTSNVYDEAGFPLLPYTSVSDWTDPATGFRGNVTSTSRWLNFNGTSFFTFPSGLYLTTHKQYDQCGSVRKAYDAKDTALLNPTLIDYSDTFKRAYPTTNTTPDPDSAGPLAALVTTMEYDLSTGLVLATVDANLQRTTYDYNDPLNRVKQVVRAATDTVSKNQTTYDYNDAAREITVTSDLSGYNDNALKSMTLYDGLGRLRETRVYESASNYIATQQEYDDFGRILRKSNAFRPPNESPAWTVSGYDVLNRITSLTTPDGAVVSTTYSGDRILVTDQNSRQRISRKDALGRLSEVWEITPSDGATEPVSFPGQPGITAGYVTKYNHNLLDRITSLTQRIGTAGTIQTRTFTYDSAERLVTESNPESGTLNYRYDNNGSPTQKIDSRSPAVTISYSYDALNRVTGRTYSNGTPSVTFVYDSTVVPNGKGRLSSISSSVSSYSYGEYDAMGRVLTGVQTTDSQAYTIGYTYDRAGHLKSQIYPSGRVVQMNFDAAGRIAGVQNQATASFYAGALATDSTNRIQYSAHGAISQMKLGNGLWEHTNFNSRLQPTQIGLGTAAGNSSVLQLDYNWGTTANNGNLLDQTITIPGLTLTQQYTYDALNRLETAKENSGSSWKQKFVYDRYGNRRLETNPNDTSPDLVGPNPVLSGLNNRIVAQSGELYAYDGAGNLTVGRDGQTYDFDGENKLVSFNGTSATYSYDGNGRRVKKVAGSETTVFVYDAMGQLLAEYTNATLQAGGTKYLTSDHLGSPRVLTDAGGAVKARHDYHPFGEEIGLKGGRNADPQKYVADNVKQKFTGKERDSETGFDYFGARYYASTQGRFTSPDPLGSWMLDRAKQEVYATNPQRWNKYLYVLNNPFRYVDPDGLAEVPSWNDLDVRVREDLAKRLGPNAEKIWNGWSNAQRQHVLNVRAVLMDKGVWKDVTAIGYGKVNLEDNWGPRNTVTFTWDNTNQSNWELGILSDKNMEYVLKDAGFESESGNWNHAEGRITFKQDRGDVILHMVLLEKPADTVTVPHFDSGGGSILSPSHAAEYISGKGPSPDKVTTALGQTSAAQYLRGISPSIDKLLAQPK